MATRTLTAEELVVANRLLKSIRSRLKVLSKGDEALEFAFRRKLYKELSYDERSKPAVRKRLKAQKRTQQEGKCFLCKKKLPDVDCVLDRKESMKGYTDENTRLICRKCDLIIQRSRAFGQG